VDAFDSESVFIGNGASELIIMATQGLLNAGDEVLIPAPDYPLWTAAVAFAGGRVVHYVKDEASGWLPDLEAMRRQITPRTRAIVVINPNNPTGSIVTRDDMELLHMGLPDQATLVSDEVYHHFVTRPDYLDSLAGVAAGRNVIVLHSFSKVYGLAGLRVGVAISRPDIIDRLARFRRTFHLGSLEMEAAIAAVGDQDHVARSVAIADQGKKRCYAAFDRLRITYWPSEGNFILFRTPMFADDLTARMADRGILVGSGSRFGLTHAIRVSIGLPEANQAFISALERILADES